MMTLKQRLLKLAYPFFNFISSLLGKNTKALRSSVLAPTSFYALKATLNNGKILDFKIFKNKKVLLVNTASDCGYTRQYEGLQLLHEKFQGKIVVIGFPSNDFGEQEKSADETIAEFCKVNYSVTFPLAKKSIVRKHKEQNEVYKWLTDKSKNGWNDVAPSWNFCKYLIDEKGNLSNFFEAGVEPMSEQIQKAINVYGE
jgi:glutathione peroxidase